MRLGLTIVLVIGATVTMAQDHDGVYRSIGDSFRKNYMLDIKDNRVVLIGWEFLPTMNKDTIYFRAETNIKDTYWTVFQEFSFSRTAVNIDTGDKFRPDTTVTIPSFLLHRHVHFAKYDDQTIVVHMIKDMYDSRFDEFVFARFK